MQDISPIVPPKKLKSTRAWKLTSFYVRSQARGRCYTCGGKYPFKKLNAGHFIEKLGSAAIYFDLRGIRAQCFYCNRRLHGNKAVFAAKLIAESGPEVITDLVKISRKSKFWRKDELEKIADNVQKLIDLSYAPPVVQSTKIP